MIKLKHILLLILLVGLGLRAFASSDGETKFEVKAPQSVAKGQVFEIYFTFNAEPDDLSFVEPSLGGLEVLAGPAKSTSTSVSVANGQTKKSYKQVLLYVVKSKKEGQFVVGKATIKSQGKEYATEPKTIEVVSDEEMEQQRSDMLKNVDIRLVVEVNSTEAKVGGEPIELLYKVVYADGFYCKLMQFDMPDFSNFYGEVLDATNYVEKVEIDGKAYNSVGWRIYRLYPKTEGTFEIKPATAMFRVGVHHSTAEQSWLSQWDGGGPFEVCEVASESIVIEVEARDKETEQEQERVRPHREHESIHYQNI